MTVLEALAVLVAGTVAGGVNAVLSPVLMISQSQFGSVSRQGRAMTFSDTADGYVRGEGCGVVVLKRLSDAVRDNDRILAVVRGGAVVDSGADHDQVGGAQRGIGPDLARELDAGEAGHVHVGDNAVDGLPALRGLAHDGQGLEAVLGK